MNLSMLCNTTWHGSRTREGSSCFASFKKFPSHCPAMSSHCLPYESSTSMLPPISSSRVSPRSSFASTGPPNNDQCGSITRNDEFGTIATRNPLTGESCYNLLMFANRNARAFGQSSSCQDEDEDEAWSLAVAGCRSASFHSSWAYLVFLLTSSILSSLVFHFSNVLNDSSHKLLHEW